MARERCKSYAFFPSSSFHSSLVGNSVCLTWVRLHQPQEQCYPFLTMHAVFLCVQTRVWLLVTGTFHMCTGVNACDCTHGTYGHWKSLHWKLDCGRKIPCDTGESNLPQRHHASLTLYRLSYIPDQKDGHLLFFCCCQGHFKYQVHSCVCMHSTGSHSFITLIHKRERERESPIVS